MSTKSENEKKPEDAENKVSAEINASLPASTEGKNDTPVLDQNQELAGKNSPNADASSAQPSEPDPDDLLEDVRRSLIEEEETQEQEDKQKWWKRIGRKSRRNTGSLETPTKAIEEISLPNLDVIDTGQEPKPEAETDEYAEKIDELIGLLDSEESEESKTDKQVAVINAPPPTPEPKPEPEKVKDIEELKKQAFEPRSSTVAEQNLTEVRSIALEGEEEVFVEVEAPKQDALEERLKAAENALKPYQRYIYVAIAVLGLVMAVIAGLVLFNIYRETVAANAPTPVVSDVPYPTSVSLPGGWTFKLGKGSAVDGNWDPKGAEWLQGTEVSRWVALPWSRQLEAVIRTLNPDDPIKLGMSNNDTLTYKVYSIKQMNLAEMQKLDSNTPSLLIILVQPDSDKRWVLTSLP